MKQKFLKFFFFFFFHPGGRTLHSVSSLSISLVDQKSYVMHNGERQTEKCACQFCANGAVIFVPTGFNGKSGLLSCEGHPLFRNISVISTRFNQLNWKILAK